MQVQSSNVNSLRMKMSLVLLKSFRHIFPNPYQYSSFVVLILAWPFELLIADSNSDPLCANDVRSMSFQVNSKFGRQCPVTSNISSKSKSKIFMITSSKFLSCDLVRSCKHLSWSHVSQNLNEIYNLRSKCAMTLTILMSANIQSWRARFLIFQAILEWKFSLWDWEAQKSFVWVYFLKVGIKLFHQTLIRMDYSAENPK